MALEMRTAGDTVVDVSRENPVFTMFPSSQIRR